jgi:hypothetical protein
MPAGGIVSLKPQIFLPVSLPYGLDRP